MSKNLSGFKPFLYRNLEAQLDKHMEEERERPPTLIRMVDGDGQGPSARPEEEPEASGSSRADRGVQTANFKQTDQPEQTDQIEQTDQTVQRKPPPQKKKGRGILKRSVYQKKNRGHSYKKRQGSKKRKERKVRKRRSDRIAARQTKRSLEEDNTEQMPKKFRFDQREADEMRQISEANQSGVSKKIHSDHSYTSKRKHSPEKEKHEISKRVRSDEGETSEKKQIKKKISKKEQPRGPGKSNAVQAVNHSKNSDLLKKLKSCTKSKFVLHTITRVFMEEWKIYGAYFEMYNIRKCVVICVVKLQYPKVKLQPGQTDSIAMRGRLVWAKLQKHMWWPATVIDGEDCGHPEARDRRVWVFWYGENTVSEMPLSRVVDFFDNYKKIDMASTKKRYQKALHEVLVEVALRINDQKADERLGSLLRWGSNLFYPFNKSADLLGMSDQLTSRLQLMKEKVLKAPEKKKNKKKRSCMVKKGKSAPRHKK